MIDYSSSNAISFISGKSNNSDTVISKPTANLCKVFSLGFFVFPFIKLSTVDCVIPDSVANLFTVISRSVHNAVSLLITASEYVVKIPPTLYG